MGEPDQVYRELANITKDKKKGLVTFLQWLVVLVVIVVSALWFSGILSPDRTHNTRQIALKEEKPLVHKKKITQPVALPSQASDIGNKASTPPKRLPAQKKNENLFLEQGPSKSIEDPEHMTVSTEKAPLPSPGSVQTPSDFRPITTINYPYSLHMGSSKNLILTEEFMVNLEKKGLDPYWTAVDLGEKGIWYRVFVGHFVTSDTADEYQTQKGIKADRILKTRYSVQIGLYTSKEDLDQSHSILKGLGHCPYIIEQPQKKYQLLVGAFQTKKAAYNLASRLKASGVENQVILR